MIVDKIKLSGFIGHAFVVSTGEKVSLLFPLNCSGGFTPLRLYKICVFQKIRCVVSCAIEWSSLLSFQFACSGVSHAIAVSTGTNQSFTLCVVFSCSSKMVEEGVPLLLNHLKV